MGPIYKLAVSLKDDTMKKIIYILTFIILTGCGQTSTENNSNIVLDSIAEQVSDTTILDNNQPAKQTTLDENQTEEFRKQSLSGFEKATFHCCKLSNVKCQRIGTFSNCCETPTIISKGNFSFVPE